MINNYMFHIYLGDNVEDDSTTRLNVHGRKFSTSLNTDKQVWDEIVDKAIELGFNSVLIELADGVRYKSHPEIAVEGAWEVEELKEELQRLREKGLTPYPKLNFSTAHDAWFGVYSKMVSTRFYYPVVKDLINEVIDIFDTPEMFNFGFDDEHRWSQVRYDYACYRQSDLYWHDYRFILDTIRERGVRPWTFVDPYIVDPERFLEETDKDVVISPDYYRASIYEDESTKRPKANADLMKKLESLKELPELGYEIIPFCTTYVHKYNVKQTVKYVNENVPNESVKAILVSAMQHTVKLRKFLHFEALNMVKYARADLGSGKILGYRSESKYGQNMR